MKNLKEASYCNNSGHDFSLAILIHSNNVADISLQIGQQLGLSGEQKELLYKAALYHDIGKSKIPESILYKKGKLTAREWEIMTRHSAYSEKLYLNISPISETDLEVSRMIRHHHENWDGTGYPDKLQGESIPLQSRIIRIADVFEAMTQPRVYRSFKVNNTMEIMANMQHRELDPIVFRESFALLSELLIRKQRINNENWQMQNTVSG